MRASPMPGCCSAIVIHELVFANAAQWATNGYSHGESKNLDIGRLHQNIRAFFAQGNGIIISTINSTQKYILPQLLEFGFVEDTGWVEKDKHKATPIKLLHLTEDKYNKEACLKK